MRRRRFVPVRPVDGNVLNACRIHEQTSWGGASLVDAAKVLLRAALQDSTNQQFLLLSESCAMPPLISFWSLSMRLSMVYWQHFQKKLLAQPYRIVHAFKLAMPRFLDSNSLASALVSRDPKC